MRDFLAAYRATRPERYKIEYGAGDLGLGSLKEAEEDMGDIEKGEEYTTYLKNLTPEMQEQLLRSGHRIRETGGGANPEGGGGVTVIKGDDLKKKYVGSEGGGMEVSVRKGTINPFKRLRTAFQSLKTQQGPYVNPRGL